MLTDHMKKIAERHAHDDKKEFFKTLLRYGWKEDEVYEMWSHRERIKAARIEALEAET